MTQFTRAEIKMLYEAVTTRRGAMVQFSQGWEDATVLLDKIDGMLLETLTGRDAPAECVKSFTVQNGRKRYTFTADNKANTDLYVATDGDTIVQLELRKDGLWVGGLWMTDAKGVRDYRGPLYRYRTLTRVANKDPKSVAKSAARRWFSTGV
jgi:hypothetical protein